MTPDKSNQKKKVGKSKRILISKRVAEAIQLVSSIGLPISKQSKRGQERMALALFAVANMKPETSWVEAAIFHDDKSWKVATREIISFQNEHWGQDISPGSYDDIRRKDLAYLIAAEIVIKSAGNPAASTNDPSRRYAVNPDAAELLHKFGTQEFEQIAKSFIADHGRLEDRLERRRPLKVEAKLPDGMLLRLTVGNHNVLQKSILEEFIPRFTSDGVMLYVGDTAKKILHIDRDQLKSLGFEDLAHDLLPDVIAYDRARNWIFLIEAVHSSNPISKMRHVALERFTSACTAPRVYVSAFANRQELRKWICDISWETEVWLAETPDHMIHFNGDKFLGPYPNNANS